MNELIERILIITTMLCCQSQYGAESTQRRVHHVSTPQGVERIITPINVMVGPLEIIESGTWIMPSGANFIIMQIEPDQYAIIVDDKFSYLLNRGAVVREVVSCSAGNAHILHISWRHPYGQYQGGGLWPHSLIVIEDNIERGMVTIKSVMNRDFVANVLKSSDSWAHRIEDVESYPHVRLKMGVFNRDANGKLTGQYESQVWDLRMETRIE